MTVFDCTFQLIERPRRRRFFANEVSLRVEKPNAEVNLVSRFQDQLSRNYLNERRRIRTDRWTWCGHGSCMRRSATRFLPDAIQPGVTREVNAPVRNCGRADYLLLDTVVFQVLLIENLTACG